MLSNAVVVHLSIAHDRISKKTQHQPQDRIHAPLVQALSAKTSILSLDVELHLSCVAVLSDHQPQDLRWDLHLALGWDLHLYSQSVKRNCNDPAHYCSTIITACDLYFMVLFYQLLHL